MTYFLDINEYRITYYKKTKNSGIEFKINSFDTEEEAIDAVKKITELMRNIRNK